MAASMPSPVAPAEESPPEVADQGSKPPHEQLLAELKKIEKSDWDAVLEAFGNVGELSKESMDKVLIASAEKIDFWTPEKRMLIACRKALSERLTKWNAEKAKGESEPDAPQSAQGTYISIRSRPSQVAFSPDVEEVATAEPQEIGNTLMVLPARSSMRLSTIENVPQTIPEESATVVANDEAVAAQGAAGADPQPRGSFLGKLMRNSRRQSQGSEGAQPAQTPGPAQTPVATPGPATTPVQTPPTAAQNAYQSIQSKQSKASSAAPGVNYASMASVPSSAHSVHLMRGASLSFTAHKKEDLQMDKGIVAKAKAVVSKESLLGSSNPAAARLKQFKWALFTFILLQMISFAFYVVFHMTPETWDAIGIPIVIARGSAYGACFWTGVLFLTMSRDFITVIARLDCVHHSQFMMSFLSCYKELHVFSAWETILDACLHTLMHHIGTFVALEKYNNDQLNGVFVCAKDKDDMVDGYIGKHIGHNFLEAFQWPKCPLPAGGDVGYFDGVTSTPGLTGYALLIVIFSLGFFSRQKRRSSNFRVFYILHHLLVPAWVVLLVIHGANDWVGLGFPLVILVAGIPVLSYVVTRLGRQYRSFVCGSSVVSAKESHSGKLLRFELQLNKGYSKCEVGQYAFINVPSISMYEWHPFTISHIVQQEGGKQNITFCIMSVGQWTKKLNATFDDINARPKVYVDGPFFAPTVTMPNKSTVVGIGAGVGVTPFLSFLGGLAEEQGRGHKNAHVFWSSACATDFVLFGDLLSDVNKLTAGGGCATTFHLHATPRFQGGAGCLFDLLARDVWGTWMDRWASKGEDVGVPVFCNYQKPLHGVVTTKILDSGKPVAVAVGRPDFNAELIAVGDADESEDVFVYFCGNPTLQGVVQMACATCNELRAQQGKSQRFFFHFERFG